MQTLNTLFEKTLLDMTTVEIEKAKDDLAAGMLPHDDYKFHCGKIAGMRQVLGYFDEVNRLINER